MITAMPTKIRPFTPDDYPAVVDLSHAVYPDDTETVEEWRFRDEHRDPRCLLSRFVAEENGRIVAMGGYYQSTEVYHPKKFRVNVSVHPSHEGHGIGTSLYKHVVSLLAPFDPICIDSGAREDRARANRFLLDRGFVEVMRDWESHLDLAAFDLALCDGAEDTVTAQGIEMQNFNELAGDPDRDRKLYDLEFKVSEDMPSMDPITPPGLDHYRTAYLEHPGMLPEAWAVAVDNGEYVGLSALWGSLGSRDLYNGCTGVLREYRGRGIATALKLRNVRWAKERGYDKIRTWNSVGNRAMLGINERLGFVKQPAWIMYRKTLREED